MSHAERCPYRAALLFIQNISTLPFQSAGLHLPDILQALRSLSKPPIPPLYAASANAKALSESAYFM